MRDNVKKRKIRVDSDSSGKRVLNYSVISQCNNNCLMCIFERPDLRKNPSLEDIKKAFNGIEKFETIYITGGEPTLRKDLFEILSFLRKKFDGNIHLLTNARRFCYENYCDKICDIDLGKFVFGVPFYHYKKEIFEKISRAERSFEETVKGIKNLIKRKKSIELRIIIHKLNHEALENMAEYIINEFGKDVDKILFASMDIEGNAKINENILCLRLPKIKENLQKAISKLIKFNPNYQISLNQIPLCILDEEFRKYAKENTVVESDHVFSDKCVDCKMRKECSGIWKSYLKKYGDDELNQIK